MKKNKLLFIISIVALMVMLAACGGTNDDNKENNNNDANNNTENNEETNNDNANNENNETADTGDESGFPIVEDEITLKMFTAKSDVNASIDWNDLPAWNEYEEMTNIKLDWVEQVSMESLPEKRNLALAGGNLPDVFYASYLTNSDIFKYGEQGIFVELNDLIDEHAPNLKAIMEEDPNIEKGMTFPDGNIYSMPTIRDEDFLSVRIGPRPWIDETWLDKLDMDAPETTEEFYDFLTAVKEEDSDMAPYSGVSIDDLVSWLSGSWGLTEVGGGGTLAGLDPDGDGLRFNPIQDSYRDMLEYVHTLFDEELIEQNIFSIEWDQYMANAAEGKYASTMFFDPSSTFQRDDFTSLSALEGPDGDQMYVNVSSPLFSNGQFVITNENPDPAATVKWMDYFYSDEGSRLIYMGIEDESYIEEDGEYVYTDEIENAEHREQAISEFVPWVGIGPPGTVIADYFSGSETSEASMEAADKIEPFVPETITAQFLYTEDETKFMTSIGADIEKYVEEMRDKFISGDESIEDDGWEKYVDTLEGMGVDEYMEIQTEAYDRYNN